MNKLLCVLLCGLVAMASSEKLRTLPLNQGMVQLPRNLEVQDTTISYPTASAYSSSYMFAAQTDLGVDYISQEAINVTAFPPQMWIVISSNETVFSKSCSGISNDYECKSPNCTEVQDSNITFQTAFFNSNNATRLAITPNQSYTVASILDGTWNLTSEPLWLAGCGSTKFVPSANNIPYSSNIYGWIGLGTQENGSANFKDANPAFSFHLNGSNTTGDLIFGFDETRVSNYPEVAVLTSDELWRLNVSSISYGGDTNISYTPITPMTLVFDVMYNGIALPDSLFTQLKTEWQTQDDIDWCSDSDDWDSYHCSISDYNLSMVHNLTFTLSDGKTFSIDPYHYWISTSYPDYVPDNETYQNTWSETINKIKANNSGSEYIVLGWSPMSQFYSLFQKTTTGNTITLYNPAPQFEGANYTVPQKPDNGNGGNGGNSTNPDGSSDGGSTDTSGDDDAWITYLTYAGVAAVVIIFIVVVACCCCKSEPKPTAKKTLTVELRGADKSTESSVASSVRL